MIRLGARSLMVLGFIAALMLAPALLAAVPWSPTLFAWLGMSVSLLGMVWFVLWVLGQELDDAIDGINEGIRVDRQMVAYHCAAHGHAFCHPELHNGQRVWRCENCGDAVVSGPGWVDGGESA